MIRFLLNREIRVEERLDPNLTVLDYLRRHLGKTGTKRRCWMTRNGASSASLRQRRATLSASRM
ncbi:hypothetical protein AO886_33335 [Pseudomonas aeruginosa]|nr:hypothetical protein AO886_33335 [Pseudomonas aeruginosa]